ncbi:hypothetical protein KM043_015405 [Ampulex compressa]|nr:hypothetical protein KM043_015405 [Ampulex compressa]
MFCATNRNIALRTVNTGIIEAIKIMGWLCFRKILEVSDGVFLGNFDHSERRKLPAVPGDLEYAEKGRKGLTNGFTHRQLGIPAGVIGVSPMETRHGRKNGRDDHAGTVFRRWCLYRSLMHDENVNIVRPKKGGRGQGEAGFARAGQESVWFDVRATFVHARMIFVIRLRNILVNGTGSTIAISTKHT